MSCEMQHMCGAYIPMVVLSTVKVCEATRGAVAAKTMAARRTREDIVDHSSWTQGSLGLVKASEGRLEVKEGDSIIAKRLAGSNILPTANLPAWCREIAASLPRGEAQQP